MRKLLDKGLFMRKQLNKSVAAVLLAMAACASTFTSCDDDSDYEVPSVITEVVCATTNSSKVVNSITLDNGTTYNDIVQQIKADVADTTFRCLATYALNEDNQLKFYQLKHIFSADPVDASKFKEKPHHPIHVISTWKGNEHYANLHVGIMTTNNGKHQFAYSIDSIVGTTKHISLVHAREEKDAESYTEKTFISLPLHPEQSQTNATVLHINTYNGWKEYKF